MAKSWINDRWLTDAIRTLDDGSKERVSPPSTVKRALSMHMDDPEKAKVPEEFRTDVFGKGSRWTVFWTANGERHRKNFRDYRKADEFWAGLECILSSRCFGFGHVVFSVLVIGACWLWLIGCWCGRT